MGKKAPEGHGMETKAADTVVVEVNDRTITGIVSVFGVKDSYNDIIKKGAFKKTIKENISRVKHLWQHDWREPPVAAIKRLWEEGKSKLPKIVKEKFPEATGGLFVTREYLKTPRGDEILAGIKSEPPAINEMSIGYDPIAVKFVDDKDSGFKTRILEEVRLWDASDVNWGANAATVAEKCIAFKQTPCADISKPWHNEAEKALADISDLKLMSTWFNEEAESFDIDWDVALLHHECKDDYPVNFEGVKTCMLNLLFPETCKTYSSSEKEKIYDHLAKHYEQFDKEPPDFKVIELAYQANQLIDDNKGCPIIMETLAPLIKYAEKQIAAEPVRPLTVSEEEFLALKTRVEIMSREVN
jgi:HK97 family phage prohead protease